MATDKHSKRCSPSKLELELKCPMAGEFYFNQTEDKSGPEAIKGSQTHLIAETILRNTLDIHEIDTPLKSVEEAIGECDLYDSEMFRLANLYASSVISEVEGARRSAGEEPFILIENTVDLSYLVPDNKDEIIGTLDFGYISGETLAIEDLKTGRIVKTAGKRNDDETLEINPQLGAYCSGVLHQYESLYPVRNIRLVIHQERMNNVSEFEMTIDEFRKWESTVLIPGVAKLYSEKLEAVPNPMCKYCPGKGSCMARMLANMSTYTAVSPAVMNNEQLEALLPKLDELKAFADDVMEEAIKRVKDGHKFRDHKLVYGQSRRAFKDEAETANYLNSQGIDPYSAPELKGIGELEKELGKKRMAELLKDYIITKNCGLKLVPLKDKRTEVSIDDLKENS